MITIIGTGNLAIDLRLECDKRKIPHTTDVCYQSQFIINTVGGRESLNYDELYSINILRNQNLCDSSRSAQVIAFSSNAVLEPNLTNYSKIKFRLEMLQEDYQNLHVFRVNTLYGQHKPQYTFPYKVIKNNPKRLPENPIIPTPTDWLAGIIIGFLNNSHFKKYTTLAPAGKTTPLEWGRMIKPFISSKGFDPERSRFAIKSDVVFGDRRFDMWDYLWKQRQNWYF